MANNCDTKYVFVGDEAEIADFHKKIELLSNNSTMDRSLKNLGSVCGVCCDGIDCDGDIGCYELETPTKLELEVITVHRENNAVFIPILKDYPSLQCYFSAECNDSEYYVTNDYGRQYFPERFIIKQGGEEPEYCNNLPDFFKSISERLQTNTDSKDKVVDIVSKWNKSHDRENQIEANEIELVDSLCQKSVKIIVDRMESALERYPKIRYSYHLYQDIDFVATTQGNKEFVWVVYSNGTVIYRIDSVQSVERLLKTMDFFDKYERQYHIHYHTNNFHLYPRPSEAIREWAKERIKELTEQSNIKN